MADDAVIRLGAEFVGDKAFNEALRLLKSFSGSAKIAAEKIKITSDKNDLFTVSLKGINEAGQDVSTIIKELADGTFQYSQSISESTNKLREQKRAQEEAASALQEANRAARQGEATAFTKAKVTP